MNLLTTEELVAATGGRLLRPCPSGGFSSVAADSRNVSAGSLFVPLVGTRDGHSFIPEAVGKGASAVLVSRVDAEISAMAEAAPSVAFVAVSDTMRALQDAAAAYVAKFPRLVRCAVTGSSGKTTTRSLLSAMLSRRFSVVSTSGNLNSETGLPLSVFSIRSGHGAGVFELGMNRAGEMAEISRVLRPEFVVVTNIGTAHIGILGSRGAIAAQKKLALDYIGEGGAAVIPAADDYAGYLASGVRGKVVRYGADGARCRLVSDEGLLGSRILVDGVEVRVPLPGRHNALDAIGAAELALELGVPAEEIRAAVESMPPLGGRSEIIRGRLTVVKDCYNANPDSMAAAIRLVSGVEGRKILVLGEMLELGAESERAHAEVAGLAEESGAELVVLVGDSFAGAECAGAVKVGGRGEEAVAAAAAAVNAAARDGDVLLVKGSRAVALERLLPLVGM